MICPDPRFKKGFMAMVAGLHLKDVYEFDLEVEMPIAGQLQEQHELYMTQLECTIHQMQGRCDKKIGLGSNCEMPELI